MIGLLCFAIFSLSLTALVWFTRNTSARVVAVISCILIFCFLISVIIDSQNQSNRICGVIVNSEVVARQGDGNNYSASFKEPLHTGTEFDLLERRPGWFHIRLGDNSDGWVPRSSAQLI